MDVRGGHPPRAKYRWSQDSYDETYAELDRHPGGDPVDVVNPMMAGNFDDDVDVDADSGGARGGQRAGGWGASRRRSSTGSTTLHHFTMRSKTLAKNIFNKAQMLSALAAETDSERRPSTTIRIPPPPGSRSGIPASETSRKTCHRPCHRPYRHLYWMFGTLPPPVSPVPPTTTSTTTRTTRTLYYPDF